MNETTPAEAGLETAAKPKRRTKPKAEAAAPEAESAPLLGFLFRHQVKPEFTCRFQWRVGSLAFWDNRCVQHNPVNDYHGYRRVMHRITLAGDRPR